jgi:hypothetical protein
LPLEELAGAAGRALGGRAISFASTVLAVGAALGGFGGVAEFCAASGVAEGPTAAWCVPSGTIWGLERSQPAESPASRSIAWSNESLTGPRV